MQNYSSKFKIYNTLSREIEQFRPIDPHNVGIYSCGPTVYDYQHIGHMRRYVGDDLLKRVLEYNGYKVKHVMNITDVGHLTSDQDSGEDKMEKGAKKFNLSVWDLAKKFEKQFLNSMQALNIQEPEVVMHATDYIKDQITLINALEEKGYTYKISDGIYFDTSKLSDYTKLSKQNPQELKAGARVEIVKGKKKPTDFALWKFTYSKGRSFDSAQDDVATRRQMEWESPWGIGFPGWHIECSAMSMLSLGPTFDIHTGGIDHISVHHTNEIAQSESATNRQFVNYWVHHAFLMVDSQKMSKSLGNVFTVQDIINKGYDPMSLRYLYLQTHYRQEMNFTFEALEGAQKALYDFYDKAMVFGANQNLNFNNREPSLKVVKSLEEFEDAINSDLDMPGALAALHEGLKQTVDDLDLMFLLNRVDEIFGLKLKERGISMFLENQRLNLGIGELSEKEKEILKLVEERNKLRKLKKFTHADQIRNKLKKMGYDIEDKKGEKTRIRKIR